MRKNGIGIGIASLFIVILLFGCSSSKQPRQIDLSMKEVEIPLKDIVIYKMVLSPDGKYMAIANDNELVVLENDPLNHWKKYLEVEKEGLSDIAWSPVDNRIALTYFGAIELFDVENKTTIGKKEVNCRYAPLVQWSSDGKKIVNTLPMSHTESHPYLFEVRSGDDLQIITTYPDTRDIKHLGGTDSIIWNPNSTENAIMISDGTDAYFIEVQGLKDLQLNCLFPFPLIINWVDEQKFLIVTNEISLEEEDSKYRTRILLYNGESLMQEIIKSSWSEDPNFYRINSAVYDNKNKLFTTMDIAQTIDMYQIIDDRLERVTSFTDPQIKQWDRLARDPKNQGVYLYNSTGIYFISFFR